MRRLDITGEKYGKLTVLEFLRMDGSHARYKCKCECGKETEVYSNNLRRNHTTSCGCESIKNKEKFATIGVTHGLSHKHPLYTSWIGMRNRCYYKKHNRYNYYGGKGIVVCSEWKDCFEKFYKWAISKGWAFGLSIDRIDNSKNYCPENCKFSTSKEQARNKTNNFLILLNGEIKTSSEWEEVLGIKSYLLRSRYKKGWSEFEIINGRVMGNQEKINTNEN